MRTLSTRLMLSMTAVAVLVALLAGILTAPLIANATREAVREPLAQQADILARLSPAALRSERLDRLSSRSEVVLGLVAPDGSTEGVASALSPAQRARLGTGRPVSSEVRYDGDRLIVEARPTADGGAVVVAKDVRVAEAVRALLLRRVVLAIVLGLAIAVAVASVLARRLARPLAETAAAARRLADGERGVPLPESSTREVAEVAAALGHLDSALTTSEGRQREFLQSVSHELRTPLTTIRGYAEGLRDGVVSADELASVGRTLVAEAERMERYVADLLALSRLEADDFALEPAEVDLVGVVEATVSAWSARAALAGVSVETELAPVGVVTDPARVRQVLDILVDNAIRVCGPGNRLVLATWSDPAGARLEVRDSGPGLTPEEMAVAFRPGVLHDRNAGRAGQAGLGLAIAHRLVTRLGGALIVTEAAEGGAAFVVLLPDVPPN